VLESQLFLLDLFKISSRKIILLPLGLILDSKPCRFKEKMSSFKFGIPPDNKDSEPLQAPIIEEVKAFY
jgi:hypothetical protein